MPQKNYCDCVICPPAIADQDMYTFPVQVNPAGVAVTLTPTQLDGHLEEEVSVLKYDVYYRILGRDIALQDWEPATFVGEGPDRVSFEVELPKNLYSTPVGPVLPEDFDLPRIQFYVATKYGLFDKTVVCVVNSGVSKPQVIFKSVDNKYPETLVNFSKAIFKLDAIQ